MRKLNKEDIMLKNVDTIGQYKILEYLEKHLNIDEFQIYLIDRNNIKIVDKEDEYLYFNYDTSTKEITYQEELDKNNEFEIGI